MLKQFLEGRKRAVAWEYMKHASKKNAAEFPQIMCYSFDHIAQYINFDGRYEQRELKFILDNFPDRFTNKTVLDIGANIGNHTVAFAPKAKRVFSFEPHPRNYQLLAINASSFLNVTTFNMGVSDKKQTLVAVTPDGNMGGTAITPNAQHAGAAGNAVEFSLVSLDDMPDVVSQDIGFVKIDVEGHELSALQGMRKILETQKPLIAFEQHADEINNGTSPVIEFLKASGYHYFYELAAPATWRTSSSLPAAIRVPMKLAEHLILGKPVDKPRLENVTKLDKRSYFMLFASAFALRH